MLKRGRKNGTSASYRHKGKKATKGQWNKIILLNGKIFVFLHFILE